MPRHRTMRSLVCAHCGEGFQRAVVNGNKSPKHCSRACADAARPRPDSRISATCIECGEQFKAFPSRIRAGRQCCGNKCRAASMRRLRPRPLEARFWEKVQKSDGPDACWLWTGAPDRDGYGFIGVIRNGASYTLRAHRVALEMQLGRPLGDGMKACHRCDNPPCVRNDGENSHLFEGTELDNKRDMYAKGRGIVGTNSHNSKHTVEQIQQIRELAATGVTYAQIGQLFGLHRMTVGRIVRRERYR